MREIFFVLIFCAYGCGKKAPIITGLEGNELPDFKLLQSDSATVFSSKSLKTDNRPAILFFFSPTCLYSKAQLRLIIANLEKLDNMNFVIITSVRPSIVRATVKEYEIEKYSNITIGSNGKMFDKFNVTTIPYLAVYDAGKRLKGCFVGSTSCNDIKNLANN